MGAAARGDGPRDQARRLMDTRHSSSHRAVLPWGQASRRLGPLYSNTVGLKVVTFSGTRRASRDFINLKMYVRKKNIYNPISCVLCMTVPIIQGLDFGGRG